MLSEKPGISFFCLVRVMVLVLKKEQWISAPGNEVDGYPLFDVFMIAFAVLLRCLILL